MPTTSPRLPRADATTSRRSASVPLDARPIAPARPDGAGLRQLARLSAFATLLGAVVLALLHLTPSLTLPDLERGATLTSWSTWLTRVDPADLLMGVVRLGAIGLAAYLLVAVTLELLARSTGLVRLQAVGARVSTPLTRRLVAQVAGLGLSATVSLITVAPAAPAPAHPVVQVVAMQPTASGPTDVPSTSPMDLTTPTTTAPADTTTTTDDPSAPVMRSLDTDPSAPVMRSLDTDPSAPVMRSLDEGASPVPGPTEPTGPVPQRPDRRTDTTADVTVDPATDAPTMRLLDPSSIPRPAGAAAGSPPPIADPGPAPSGAEAAAITEATATADLGTWLIRRGDHLWGVARRTLAGAWHRPPTDAEVARYLDALVTANAAVLVVPGDTDLVFAGQVFVLPPVPAA